MGHQEVRPCRRRQGVLVGLPQDRQDQLPEPPEGAPAGVHEPWHHGGIGHEGGVGTDDSVAQSESLDFLLVACAGGDDRLVTSCLEPEGDGKVRVQVAQRSERGEDDPPPETGSRLGWDRSILLQAGHHIIPSVLPCKW